tara:strand:+ start:10487 stop:12391 length:1905 start_codon:yes stop_codon:yes gene_type:complete
MPALWPKFIPDLADDITSQQFKKPGGAGTMIGMPVPAVGANNQLGETVSGQKSILSGGITDVGNPANAALKTNPATMINANNTAPKSGRYDFGVRVAERYIEAVKNNAQTHVAEFHVNNGAAEQILKDGYGWAFERLLMEGDIPLQDQFDEDGNLTEMGKESHPAYADFCPTEEETAGPDLEELKKKNDEAFEKFTKERRQEYDLHKFKFYHFPCLSGEESQEELEVIFATRILMGFEFMTSKAEKWNYFTWACHLGKENYGSSNSAFDTTQYKNISSRTRNDIEDAGYDYKLLADNVSKYVKDAIMAAHPKLETDFNSLGNNSTLEQRIKRDAVNPIEFPTLQNSDGVDITPDFCPINRYKIQVAFDFENDPPEFLSQRPKILTANVVATFTYYPGKRQGNSEGYVVNNDEGRFSSSGPTNSRFEKSTSWVRQNYEKDEFEKKWRKVPKAKLLAASKANNPEAKFLEIDPKPQGTLFKFEYHKTVCAKIAAEKCEEPMAEVAHPWRDSYKGYSGDPYMMMARVTIAYWYACLVQPFKASPSAPPALITPPLGGIYIPIYYGSANRLANNLRRAWNTGKSFSKLPAKQPPAIAVSTAVAGAYAIHLLEFKLLYLGGIPTPGGPVPMVGFVPVVF